MGELPAPEKVRQLCHQLGDLLPFLVDDHAKEARGLLGALLEWVQTSLGTTVSVDSQGGSETQPNLLPEEVGPAALEGGVPSTALDDYTAVPPGGTIVDDSGPDVVTLPAFWSLRGDMAELNVSSSAERDPESQDTGGGDGPQEPLDYPSAQTLHDQEEQEAELLRAEEEHYRRVGRRRLLSPEGSRRRVPPDYRSDDSD